MKKKGKDKPASLVDFLKWDTSTLTQEVARRLSMGTDEIKRLVLKLRDDDTASVLLNELVERSSSPPISRASSLPPIPSSLTPDLDDE